MSKPKIMRIDFTYTEYMDLYSFCLENKDIPELAKLLKKLELKLQKLKEEDAYHRSKTAETPELREAARIEYCELKGIPQSFRW